MPAEAPPRQLYDLEADPEESRNLHDRERARVEELEALLEAIRQGRPPPV
jgi:hypothetical protein